LKHQTFKIRDSRLYLTDTVRIPCQLKPHAS